MRPNAFRDPGFPPCRWRESPYRSHRGSAVERFCESI
jgi:hypothetical protein